ncbi:MAG: histidinol-phosphate transaminase [Fimbriimonadales bacterium]|nr:histidinol-phosphate transaminase [Fimbriimonadales bacterium]
MGLRIRPNVRRMVPYSPGKPVAEVQRELGLDSVVKLASNENPLGPSPKAVEAVRRAAACLHVYPDGSAYELRQALSRKFGVPPSQILLGNGSDELIHLLGLVFLGAADDEMVVGDPSFVRYDAAAHLADCRLVKVPLDGDLVHDLKAMARAITPGTKMVFVANPNNPTGTIVRKPEVDAFLRDLPDGVVLVLDEAYYEFAADVPDFPSSLEYVRAGKPVVGLRTFSKAYGLAGIRIGYGFAPEEVVDAVDRAREPFDVNSLAQAAAVAALEDDEHVARTVANNRAGAERIAEALREAGARVYPTWANFVYADLGRPAQPVFDALLRKGVIVRTAASMGSATGLRVSVGTPDEVERFVRAFREVASAW